MDRAREANRFQRTLETEGLHGALRFLNARTPHRFTGVYRYDGSVLRNVHLVDVFDPVLRAGADVPMCDAYCAVVGQTRKPLAFSNALVDTRFTHKPGSPVVCYCGVLLSDEAGEPFGTLCHYDVNPCDDAVGELPLLEAVAPLVFAAMKSSTSGTVPSTDGARSR